MSKHIPEDRVIAVQNICYKRATSNSGNYARQKAYLDIGDALKALLSAAVECPECKKLAADNMRLVLEKKQKDMALDNYKHDVLGPLAKERDDAIAECARLRAALRDIAGQTLSSEMGEAFEKEYADFEGGYDSCVIRARRAALKETGK